MNNLSMSGVCNDLKYYAWMSRKNVSFITISWHYTLRNVRASWPNLQNLCDYSVKKLDQQRQQILEFCYFFCSNLHSMQNLLLHSISHSIYYLRPHYAKVISHYSRCCRQQMTSRLYILHIHICMRSH